MTDRPETLDPPDWDEMRDLAHRIVDEAIDFSRDVRDRPVWQAMPKEVEEVFSAPVPREPKPLEDVFEVLSKNLLPYPMGNIHPRFWMWYMGGSNFTGALGDFLAAVLGSNLGGGKHAAALVDQSRQGVRAMGSGRTSGSQTPAREARLRNSSRLGPITAPGS